MRPLALDSSGPYYLSLSVWLPLGAQSPLGTEEQPLCAGHGAWSPSRSPGSLSFRAGERGQGPGGCQAVMP